MGRDALTGESKGVRSAQQSILVLQAFSAYILASVLRDAIRAAVFGSRPSAECRKLKSKLYCGVPKSHSVQLANHSGEILYE